MPTVKLTAGELRRDTDAAIAANAEDEIQALLDTFADVSIAAAWKGLDTTTFRHPPTRSPHVINGFRDALIAAGFVVVDGSEPRTDLISWEGATPADGAPRLPPDRSGTPAS